MSGRIDGLAGSAGTFSFTFGGRTFTAQKGETVAMALWANGQRTLRRSSREGKDRSLLCNMGICFECLVKVDGRSVRACLEPVREGMVVEPGGKP